MSSEYVAALHDNYRAAFVGLADRRAGGETARFGQVAVASAGLPFPEYNRAFVFDPPSGEDLDAAVSWLRDRDGPYWVTTTTPVIEAVDGFPAAFDLEKSHDDPGMVLWPLTEIPLRRPPAAVVSVTDEPTLDEFVSVFTAVFDRPAESTVQAYRPLLSDERTGMFLGRVDGQAVACGVLSRTDRVAGVYAVGVREAFRRRGLGEFMTWEVLRAGRDAGCRIGVLQSSELGYPLYESMGFETVVTYHHFAPSD